MPGQSRLILSTALQVLLLLASPPVVFSESPSEYTAETPDLSPKYKFSVGSFINQEFKNPTGLFVDRVHGEVYVTDGGRNELLIFDSDGGFIHRFDRTNGITAPLDVVVRDDRIYLSQSKKPYVQVFSYLGKPLKRLSPDNVVFKPGKMELADDGMLYVLNTAESNVVVFDEEDRFVRTIGEGLVSVGGLAVGGGRVYLIKSFSTSKVIHVYTTGGKSMVQFEAIAGRGGTLSVPVAGKVDGDGNLWLVDAMLGVLIYDRSYKRVASFRHLLGGSDPLRFPVDIDFGKDGMVYLLEQGSKRFSVFK